MSGQNKSPGCRSLQRIQDFASFNFSRFPCAVGQENLLREVSNEYPAQQRWLLGDQLLILGH